MKVGLRSILQAADRRLLSQICFWSEIILKKFTCLTSEMSISIRVQRGAAACRHMMSVIHGIVDKNCAIIKDGCRRDILYMQNGKKRRNKFTRFLIEEVYLNLLRIRNAYFMLLYSLKWRDLRQKDASIVLVHVLDTVNLFDLTTQKFWFLLWIILNFRCARTLFFILNVTEYLS